MRYLLIVLLLLSTSAHANFACTDWAFFSKAMAAKYRDVGTPEAILRRAVISVVKDEDLPIALNYVGYVYSNPSYTPDDVWQKVYELCAAKATL